MRQIHISRLDLNLLKMFDALMTERHVTRAGERIGLTQSGVSHALSRLRVLLNDPLFVRTPKGMMPTKTAIDMADDVHALLEHAQSLLTPRRHFDPVTSERVFRLATRQLG
ncbi:LysR family transcriptional regulator [Asticcacaulis sp. SL142]|uniref:LysR family transcriptional regulator n=1 Tax=Asticcacaulis sp. SL142 TaxID=2995155 RepID=UPI00226D1EEE|nr:LysR family transcriptional regulator [Asticcacaulis sp. SL142]WAC48202.1 LysR family transcriptional regulator [Asticcacaulis sp. SL142]